MITAISSKSYQEDTDTMIMNVLSNIAPNAAYLFSMQFMSLFFTLFAIAGLVYLLRKRAAGHLSGNGYLIIPAWIIIYFAMHLLRYNGAYSVNEVSARCILDFAPAPAVPCRGRDALHCHPGTRPDHESGRGTDVRRFNRIDAGGHETGHTGARLHFRTCGAGPVRGNPLSRHTLYL